MRERWVSTAAGSHLAGRKNRNTAPEVTLRRAIHRLGLRFRLHVQLAPGCTPDVVLARHRLALFVDGCLWHGCPQHGRAGRFTGPNAALWEAKMQRNATRDLRATALAESLGFRVLRLWECAVIADPARAAEVVLAATTRPAPAR